MRRDETRQGKVAKGERRSTADYRVRRRLRVWAKFYESKDPQSAKCCLFSTLAAFFRVARRKMYQRAFFAVAVAVAFERRVAASYALAKDALRHKTQS